MHLTQVCSRELTKPKIYSGLPIQNYTILLIRMGPLKLEIFYDSTLECSLRIDNNDHYDQWLNQVKVTTVIKGF